jgi:hypothetical protein
VREEALGQYVIDAKIKQPQRLSAHPAFFVMTFPNGKALIVSKYLFLHSCLHEVYALAEA